VTPLLAAAAVEELGDRDIGEPESAVELAVRQQTAVGGDPGAVEFQLDPAVEIHPKRLHSRFTHRVRHDRTSSPAPSL
jgi:hypothetical protein